MFDGDGLQWGLDSPGALPRTTAEPLNLNIAPKMGEMPSQHRASVSPVAQGWSRHQNGAKHREIGATVAVQTQGQAPPRSSSSHRAFKVNAAK